MAEEGPSSSCWIQGRSLRAFLYQFYSSTFSSCTTELLEDSGLAAANLNTNTGACHVTDSANYMEYAGLEFWYAERDCLVKEQEEEDTEKPTEKSHR